ncbi:fatty acyl-CoA reductase 2, chloroplastic-like [Apium graveolens]|uniref:fatty acyl-CoA reductase 2, chloroplastic-like n=1 Tax=Apium graveolens TaxID=4045 RepID=UPI003D7A8F02
MFLRNKTSTNVFFCVNQTSRNFSSRLRSCANMHEKHSAVLANDRLSSNVHDGGLGIADFFSGKKLLITGYWILSKRCTLLTSMAIVNTELFKCLREEHETFFKEFILNKLVPEVGNMCETNLGIEEDAGRRICFILLIVLLSSRFDVALDLNTVGAARIVNFAKKCEKLKLYVHISTGNHSSSYIISHEIFVNLSAGSAYASRQSEGKIIEQSFGKGHYVASSSDILAAPHKLIHGLDIAAEIKLASEMKKSFKENEIDQKLKDLGMSRAQKYQWPNTYAFTKAMGEMVVEDIKGHLPVIIIRPSIIESTSKEPFPGWIEGNRMIDPIMLLYGKGKLPGFYSDPNIALDVIPVDIVVNSTLAAIAKHGREESKPEDNDSRDDHVYQITSSVSSSIHLNKAYLNTKNNKCRFDNNGVEKLMKCLSEKERKEFGFDVSSIDWKDYFISVHFPGIRKHVMKERVLQFKSLQNS